jgi:hypothetical protein
MILQARKKAAAVGGWHSSGIGTSRAPSAAVREEHRSKTAAEAQREERIGRFCDRLTGDLRSAVLALDELVRLRSTSPRPR